MNLYMVFSFHVGRTGTQAACAVRTCSAGPYTNFQNEVGVPYKFMPEARSSASILQLGGMSEFLQMGTTRRSMTYQLVHMHVIRNPSGNAPLPAATLH